jgi:hypothetical protein
VRLKHLLLCSKRQRALLSTPEEDSAFCVKFRAEMQNREPKDWPLPWPTLRADYKRLKSLRDKPEITADEYVAAAEAALVSFVSTRIARQADEVQFTAEIDCQEDA